MKIPRFPILLTITLLFGLLLSACSGAAPINTWPGLSAGENTVYLAYQTGVFAVDVNNGGMTWRFPGEVDGAKTFYAPPAVSDNQIVAGSYTNALYGLEPATGSQLWEFVKESGYFVASPLVTDDTILAPSSDNSLYALDLKGSPRWTFKTGNVLWAQPVSDGELVYLPAMDHNLYALRLTDGSKVWSADLGASIINAPVMQDDVLYAVTMAGQLYAVNAQDGAILWSHNVGEKIWGSPILHEGNLFIGTTEGNVYAFSTEGAADPAERMLWSVAIEGPVIGAGAVTSKGLVFTTETGTVQALSYSGEKLWSQKVNGKLYTTPVVVNDTLIVAVTEGETLLTAFNVDGGQKWIFTVPK